MYGIARRTRHIDSRDPQDQAAEQDHRHNHDNQEQQGIEKTHFAAPALRCIGTARRTLPNGNIIRSSVIGCM